MEGDRERMGDVLCRMDLNKQMTNSGHYDLQSNVVHKQPESCLIFLSLKGSLLSHTIHFHIGLWKMQ